MTRPHEQEAGIDEPHTGERPPQGETSEPREEFRGPEAYKPIESLDPSLRLPLTFTERRRGKPPRHLADLTLAERKGVLTEAGLPGFRADQLSRHYFTHLTRDPEAMTDLPAADRAEMVERLLPPLATEVRRLTADGGETVKTLLELFDGTRIESVLMAYPGRNTVCISSEVGCGMACPFCATGQMGLTRNLSTAEIVEQVRIAAAACASGELTGEPARLSNIVFMGMGEPMANYNAVMGAIRRLTQPAPEGFGISARNITLSTVGLVPAIRRLIDEKVPVTLAVSLHAPDDELRDDLIPINSRWKVGELLDAARAYFEATVLREYEKEETSTDKDGKIQRKTTRGSETVSSQKSPSPLYVSEGDVRIGLDLDGVSLHLKDGPEKFEPYESTKTYTFFGVRFSAPSGVRTLGFKYREKIIPLGHPLYVTGEVRHSGGALRIGKPGEKGRPRTPAKNSRFSTAESSPYSSSSGDTSPICSRPSSRASSLPSTVISTSPDVAGTRPQMMRSKVVLPAPLGPYRTKTERPGMVTEMSANSLRRPYALVSFFSTTFVCICLLLLSLEAHCTTGLVCPRSLLKITWFQ